MCMAMATPKTAHLAIWPHLPFDGRTEGGEILMTTIDDLLQRWEEHQDSGHPVTPEELCAETPELLKELKWTIRALQAVDSRFGVISE